MSVLSDSALARRHVRGPLWATLPHRQLGLNHGRISSDSGEGGNAGRTANTFNPDQQCLAGLVGIAGLVDKNADS